MIVGISSSYSGYPTSLSEVQIALRKEPLKLQTNFFYFNVEHLREERYSFLGAKQKLVLNVAEKDDNETELNITKLMITVKLC